MESLAHKVVSAGLGSGAALFGVLLFSRCPGGACGSCFGCAAAGCGVLVATLVMKAGGKKEGGNNGVD